LKQLKTNDAIILKGVCPANIFANNRTARLNGRMRYETISMVTRNGNNNLGTPLGTNKFKNPIWLLTILIKVIPIKIDNAIVSVKIMCEVIVKPYGSKPKKFDAKIKLNKKNTIGKYLRTSRLEIWPLIRFRIKVYIPSKTNCQRLGKKVALVECILNTVKKITVINNKIIVLLVILTSPSGTKRSILNCSSGLWNIII
jgi:hypothetical protein